MNTRNIQNYFGKNVPKDIVLSIVMYLSFHDLIHVSRTNYSFYFLINRLVFEHNLLHEHFLITDPIETNHALTTYIKAANRDYALLNKRQIALLQLAKEGKYLQLLEYLTYDDLLFVDRNGRGIIDWIRQQESADATSFIKEIYTKLVDPRITSKRELLANDDNTMLFFVAVSCRELDSFISKKPSLKKPSIDTLCHELNNLSLSALKEKLKSMCIGYNHRTIITLIKLTLHYNDISLFSLYFENLSKAVLINSINRIAYVAVMLDNAEIFKRLEALTNNQRGFQWIQFDNLFEAACIHQRTNILHHFEQAPWFKKEINSQNLLANTIKSNKIKFLQILLEMGIDPNQPYDGRTPLYDAITHQQSDIITLLIKYGARLDTRLPQLSWQTAAYTPYELAKAHYNNKKTMDAIKIGQYQYYRRQTKPPYESSWSAFAWSFWNTHSVAIKREAAKKAIHCIRGKISQSELQLYQNVLESDELAEITAKTNLFKR